MNKNSQIFTKKKERRKNGIKKEGNLYNNIIRKFKSHHRILENRYGLVHVQL